MKNPKCFHSNHLKVESRVSAMQRGRNGVLPGMASLLIPFALNAQTPEGATAQASFPAYAQVTSAQALQGRLEGHVFVVNLKDGSNWRLQFKGKYVFINLSSGANDSGVWRTEDGKLCVDYQRFPSGCSEMRGSDKELYLKRTSTGEVVRFEPND